MAINKQGISVPEEKGERTKLRECLEHIEHSALHPDSGPANHTHHHGPHQKEFHHGSGEKHNGYDPKNTQGFYKKHSHSHAHENDPLASLDDGGQNGIEIADNELSDFNENGFEVLSA